MEAARVLSASPVDPVRRFSGLVCPGHRSRDPPRIATRALFLDFLRLNWYILVHGRSGYRSVFSGW
jgi:hypothetical protein